MKKCSICKTDKPETEYYKLSRGNSTYPYCRDCARQKAKQNREKESKEKLNTALYLPI